MIPRKIQFLTLLLFILTFGLSAQNIAVKSFRAVPDDMTARVTAPIIDQNGDKCALIKVRTSQKGFVFDGDMNGITKTKQDVGEVWVYLPQKSKKITIKHQQLGVLDKYIYPEVIKEATVYIMELTTGKVTTTVEDIEIPMQWFTISSTPNGADVYIGEQLVGSTPYQKKMKVGKYNYRLEKAMYHNSAGVLSLTDTKKEEVNLVLKPNFGFVSIVSIPESGASLEIDGRPVSEKTPFQSESLLSGKHRVVLKKIMFQPKTMDFEINDGETTHLNVELLPNFAELTIESSPSAEIYIDDEKRGTSIYSGRLLPGLHSLEARKDKHTSSKKQLEFVAGQKQTVSLIPMPKTGSADVISTPFGAEIKIDGKSYGTTPNTIKNLLIGDYSMELSKAGYGTVLKTINISENKTAEIEEILPGGKEVSISSTPSGANVYKGETFIGTTPLKTTLAFGTHKIRVSKEDETDTKQINIIQNGETTFSFNVEKFAVPMVFVKGGSYQMGSNNGEDDEKPIHSVRLDDFYIGKYEVTQALWKAVMGNNPSNFKGDNLPVEEVTRVDVQTFITKLNQKTGKTYRLPTEAEWEFAARGGTLTSLSDQTTYAGSNIIGDVAWYKGNSNLKTHEVGGKQANELGIYDMSGNVEEWCSDRYYNLYYNKSPRDNPQGPRYEPFHVVRGGNWTHRDIPCRVADRTHRYEENKYSFVGFRLATSLDHKSTNVSEKVGAPANSTILAYDKYDIAKLKNDGNAAIKVKDFKTAIINYEKYLSFPEAASDFATAYNTAYSCERIKDYAKAVVYYDKAIAGNYKLDRAYLRKANAQKKLQDFDAMIATLEAGVAAVPAKNSRLTKTLARSYLLEGIKAQKANEFDKTEAYYKKAIAIKSSMKTDAIVLLGTMYLNQGLMIYKKANLIVNTDKNKFVVETTKAKEFFKKALGQLHIAKELAPDREDVDTLIQKINARL